MTLLSLLLTAKFEFVIISRHLVVKKGSQKSSVPNEFIGGMPFGPPLNNPLTVTDEDDFGNTLLVKRMTWFPLLLVTGLNHLKAVMVLMINIYFKPRQ